MTYTANVHQLLRHDLFSVDRDREPIEVEPIDRVDRETDSPVTYPVPGKDARA